MLGMSDPWVAVSWVLSVASMVACVTYGAIMWNKGGGGE